MVMFASRIIASLLLLFPVIFAIHCIDRDGELVLREGNRDVSPSPFPCLKELATTEATKIATFNNKVGDQAICDIRIDSRRKSKFVLTGSKTVQSHYCKHKCTSATKNAFTCTSVPENGQCNCEPSGPHVEIVSVKGTGPNALDETCFGRVEGYQFPDPVACVSIRADVTKTRATFLPGRENECKVETRTLPETRFMKSMRAEKNLQGCYYVCKKRAPRCLEPTAEGRCRCSTNGLRKVLVGMSESNVGGVLDQISCKETKDCGPCAICNLNTGDCVLHKNAADGKYCRCGERCPSEDFRSAENRGGKILCIPNVDKICMRRPEWISDNSAPGTKYPTYCTKGATDKADTCSCAPGYDQVNLRFGGVMCQPSAGTITGI